MSTQFEGMSDAELNEVIYNSEASEDLGVSDDHSVSPMIGDSSEQSNESTVDNGVDQSTNGNENSGDDSTVEGQTDDNGQDTSNTTDEGNEEDTNGNEDKGTEADDKQSNGISSFQPLKANGKEYPIDSIEELYKMASAGVGAQHKFQAIAAHKKSIVAAERAGVNIDEAVNFMANYKENPRDAIARLLKDNNIDPLEYDADANIAAAKDYSVTDFEIKYDEVIGEIGASPLFPKVQDVLLNQWDQSSRNIFLEKPEMIRNLHEEMTVLPGMDKSMFDIVTPIAEKMRLSGDIRSNYEIYMDARGKKVAEFEAFETAKRNIAQPVTKNINDKKRSASPTGGAKAGVPTLDFSAMSDAELDAFLDKA